MTLAMDLLTEIIGSGFEFSPAWILSFCRVKLNATTPCKDASGCLLSVSFLKLVILA